MSDSTAQLSNHACITDNHPPNSLVISPNIQATSSHHHHQQQQHPHHHQQQHQHQHQHHTNNNHHPSIISAGPNASTGTGSSVSNYHHPQAYHFHNQNHPLVLYHPHYHHPHQPPQRPLETFDPGFQVPSTQALGLLPMPVAYEDFQYALPNRELLDQMTSRDDGQSDVRPSAFGSIYQTYPDGSGRPEPNYHLSLSSGWNLSPETPARLPPSTPQDIILRNFLEPIRPHQLASSALLLPLPSSAPLDSKSCASVQPSSRNDNFSHNLPQTESQLNYPPPNPKTPPPLFDASEKDLLSSFLNIFGDSSGECDFDPQGMPEGMPVLGELKRKLEANENDQHGLPVEKREAEEIGKQVETRLRITNPDSVYPQLRRPSIQSLHTTSGSLSSSSDSHLYQDQPSLSRKKVRITSHSNPLNSVHSIYIPDVPHRGSDSRDEDIKLESWSYRNRHGPDHQWTQNANSSQTATYANQAWEPYRPIPIHSTSISPEFPSASDLRIANNIRKTSFDSETLQESTQFLENQQAPEIKPGSISKRGSKPPKTTHLVSEQRRRNAIQGGFGNLVEILRAGEAASGISIATVEPPSHNNNRQDSNGGLSANSKPKTRGRGRRGEIETGASKSVVLERAAEFVQWMADGNLALNNEVDRIEQILQSHGLQL